MRALRSLFVNLLRRDRVEDELDEEVRAMVDLLVAEKIQGGMRPRDARRAAALEIGGVESVKEQVREARAGAFVDTLLQDVRYGTRMLRRNPLFALTAALSLAIGIGANTTIFTIVNALLFRAPAGVAEPGRLVDIGIASLEKGGGFNPGSYPNYLDIRQRTTTLEGVYGHVLFGGPMSLQSGDGAAERIFSSGVTANYFALLGARAAAGRFFDPQESERPGAPEVVVLSHRFWTRRFNRDPGVVGRTLQINGRPFVVLGVAAEGFHGTRVQATDVWVPVNITAAGNPTAAARLMERGSSWLMMGGRLKPGVSIAQAAAEIDTIGRALAREYPDENDGKAVRLQALSPVPGTGAVIAAFLILLTGIVTSVLVIACANVAGVLLARAAARQREIAVRLAIGAGRRRLVRQLLTETALLFLLGGAAGLLLARVMTSLLVATLPALPFPVDVSLALDGRAVAYTAGLSLVAAILAGLAPALHASKADLVSALKADTQLSSGRSRLRGAFVVAQVALSLLLVIGAGLFARALQRAGSIDPGFDAHGVELASLDLSVAGYTDVTGRRFATDVLARVRSLPDVQSAAIAAVLPGGFETMGFGVTAPGLTAPGGQRFFHAAGNMVEPGYFAAMRIPLVSGRDFNDGDRDGAEPVVIVSEALARQFWPGRSAIGQSVQLPIVEGGKFLEATKALRVVGVARDVTVSSLIDGLSPLFLYVPLQQQYMHRLTIVARTNRGQRIADELRKVVASMNLNLPIVASQTLEEYASLGLTPQRVAASVAGSLGLVGLLLAAIGIYGVTSFTVTRRTREIGIRVALGARRGAVIGLVLRHGLSLAAIGSAIGLLLAAAVSLALRGFLFDVPWLDPLSFAGAAILVAALALAACYVPVRRATRINAMEALRYE